MQGVLSLLDGVLSQGLIYGVAAIGLVLAIRVLRYPDLTGDGSFLIGAVVFAVAARTPMHWAAALAASIACGALAGSVTALCHAKLGVNRLLSGILTSMACYSIGFWITGGRPNIGLLDVPTIYTAAEQLDGSGASAGLHSAEIVVSALVTTLVISVLLVLLRSQVGLVLRATGDNSPLVRAFGRKPIRYTVVGLAVSNGLIALAGALLASRQGFADVNSGPGTAIILIAGLVMGEELLRLFGLEPTRSLGVRLLAPLVGALAYYFVFLGILRASLAGMLPVTVRPTDLKLLSAVTILLLLWVRSLRSRKVVLIEEAFPL